MFKNRKLIFLSAPLLLLVLIGSASAAEVDDIQQVTLDGAGEIITGKLSSAVIDSNSGLVELENDKVLSNSLNESSDISTSNDSESLSASDEEVLGDSIDFTGTTFSELQTQINNCNDRDTINLLGNIIQDGTSDITIDKSLTINGNGFTIDAQKKSAVFLITANDVTLKNISIINCQSRAALTIRTNNVNIINCNFTNNTARDSSHIFPVGAIQCHNTVNVTISNCNFINNFGSSGAIYGVNTENAKISNCYFNDNYAFSYGGGIYLHGKNYNIYSCNFLPTTPHKVMVEQSEGRVKMVQLPIVTSTTTLVLEQSPLLTL